LSPAGQLRRALDRLAGSEITAEEARGLLPRLFALLGTVTAKAVEPPTPAPVTALPTERQREETVLTVAEMSARAGRSATWVYRKKTKLPGFIRLPGGRFGFREKAVNRWIQRNSNNDA
jgi:predicted DNA-binding transcriptional regulator AlpA